MELKDVVFKGSGSSAVTNDLNDIIIKSNKISEDSEDLIEKSKKKIEKYFDDLEKIEKNNFKILVVDAIIASITVALIIYINISGNFTANMVYIIFSCFCFFLSLAIVFVNNRINKLDKETLIANCITLIKILEILKGEKK